MSAEKPKEVEKMIARVEKKKDLTRAQAIDYMLGVATGRLAALWRYEESVPEGKTSKGVLQIAGRKKRAPKSAKITVLPETATAKESKPKKRAPKPKAEIKEGKSKDAKPKKRAPKAKTEESKQIEIIGAAAE